MAGTLAYSGEEQATRFAEVAEHALKNARGNSGTLLSVWLNHLAPFIHNDVQSAESCVKGFLAAASAAEQALSTPVEGTMLTAMKAIATAKDIEAARDLAEDTVQKTTSTLPALRGTNVVDAGALGFLYVLDALAQAINKPSRVQTYDTDFLIDSLPTLDPRVRMTKDHGVEVMATVTADLFAMSNLRNQLEGLGDSLSVARVGEGEPASWAVHVHVSVAEDAITALNAAGEVENLRITSLDH